MGVQIAVDKITAALAAHQRASIKHLIKDKRTFGLWSPRRCDVYVCDHQSGHLSQRLEIAATLWQNEISADVMYEAAVDESEDVTIAKCQNEGILSVFLCCITDITSSYLRFLIYHRGSSGGRQSFKIKSVLRGTEQEGGL
jgi:eukaryotic translation initiation factor 2-alpha kinase 4